MNWAFSKCLDLRIKMDSLNKITFVAMMELVSAKKNVKVPAGHLENLG